MPQRVILIGAARSGTKIVRDVLADIAGVGRVPYDIPFVWLHGHHAAPDDRLDPASLSPRSRRFITRYVDRYASGEPLVVVEKTVGNALRVPYVHRVFPDAKFVHLVRDGMDAVESTRRQWVTPPDRQYLARKLRHFPPSMLPTYGVRFAARQVSRWTSDEQRVRSWGVRYPGIDADLRRYDLLTVTARQWRWCVESAVADFEALAIKPVDVRYEDLVADPLATLSSVADQLEMRVSPKTVRTAATRIRPDRLGTGGRGLDEAEQGMVLREIGDSRRRLGYPDYTTQNRNVE